MAPLLTAERPADGTPSGLLILHHGRGADENDLLPIGDALDPKRRLHVVSPRAPLTVRRCRYRSRASSSAAVAGPRPSRQNSGPTTSSTPK